MEKKPRQKQRNMGNCEKPTIDLIFLLVLSASVLWTAFYVTIMGRTEWEGFKKNVYLPPP